MKVPKHPIIEPTRSNGGVRQAPEPERVAQQQALLDAEHHRLAKALDHLLVAVLGCDNLDSLLRMFLEMFVDVGHADVAVLLLRDGDRLRSRAAVGLEEEVEAGFSVPIDGRLAAQITTEGPMLVSPDDAIGVFMGDSIRQKRMQSLYCLNLLNGDSLVGLVLLGSLQAHQFSDEDRQLLNVLATRAGAAVVRSAAYESLRTAVRSRDEVLAIVAHDLRNPVNVIRIAANSLLRRLSDSTARRSIERIIRGATRAERLLRDLLEISAIETGHFSIERRVLEPGDLILAALESQQALAADASVIIASDVSPELPTVEADEERLLEVLENLIGNSVKFTVSGGSVTVGAARREGEVVFWVKDNGSGISTEELPHIFDRFWQPKKKRRGTGLGLSICKGIIEAHGGRIWAESAVDRGTTMFFTLPATGAPKAEVVDMASILLVDDRPENLLALKAILDRPEYRLVTAGSGEEALALALHESFSLALIDVAMPGMNGLEVAVHLKELERSREVPIIFVTALGNDPEEVHRAYSAGGADYLVKPLDPEIVRKKVAVFVDFSRRRLGNGLLRGANAAGT